MASGVFCHERANVERFFSLQIPDTFERMSPEELQELSHGSGDPYQWGVRDWERHVMIFALWKQYPSLIAWMSDPKAIAKKNEQLTHKVYGGYDYRLIGFSSLQAGDEKAEGYSFCYNMKGIKQVIQNYLIKDGKTVYAITCAGREENMAADQTMFREVMESLQFL